MDSGSTARARWRTGSWTGTRWARPSRPSGRTKAKTRQIVSVGTYETRAVKVGHSRVFFEWYRPTIRDEDADVVRNLQVIA